MGKGSVDETHPLSLGVIGNYMGPRGATRPLRDLVTEADVVLLAGTRTNENGTDAWSLLPRGATFIHLDVDGAEVGRNYEALRLVGDARLGLEDLAGALAGLDLSKRTAGEAEVAARIAEGRRLHRSEAAAVTGSGASPIRPERVMAELDTLLPDDAIVVADASYSTIWMNNYLRARRAGQRFLSPRGLAGLGWGLPLALGAKVARPAVPVVCISGDGGFGHVWAELETSVRERLPVTIILFNNAVLGFQKHAELVQYGAHTSAVELGPVDHAAIARACGADAVRVDDPAELAGVLARAVASDRTTLIEVMTDPAAHPPITAWEGRESAIAPLEEHRPRTVAT
jgi:acetolactate synthase-1/2/3 large subunit